MGELVRDHRLFSLTAVTPAHNPNNAPIHSVGEEHGLTIGSTPTHVQTFNHTDEFKNEKGNALGYPRVRSRRRLKENNFIEPD